MKKCEPGNMRSAMCNHPMTIGSRVTWLAPPRHTDLSTKEGDSRTDYQKCPSMRPVIAEKRHIISTVCVIQGREGGSKSWDRNR